MSFEWVFVHDTYVTRDYDSGWEFYGLIVNGYLIGVSTGV